MPVIVPQVPLHRPRKERPRDRLSKLHNQAQSRWYPEQTALMLTKKHGMMQWLALPGEMCWWNMHAMRLEWGFPLQA